MGTQQFLFIVVSVLVVGVAVVVGVNILTDSYADRINEILIDKIYDVGLKANTYRKRPIAMGGGSGSYKGFDDQISGMLKDDLIKKIKIKASKNRIDLTLTLKGDKKKSGKIEARFDPDGINRLRIYDPDDKKWVWLVRDKKEKKDKKDKKGKDKK